MNPNASPFPSGSEPPPLQALMQDLEQPTRSWRTEDLADLFQHQMQCPLWVDLGSLPGTRADQVRELASSRGLTLTSFLDLLRHPQPPLELLILSKEFAKRNLLSPEPVLPNDIARVLYYSCIALAHERCDSSISSLDLSEIRDGVRWCLRRNWMDTQLREILNGLKLQEGEAS